MVGFDISLPASSPPSSLQFVDKNNKRSIIRLEEGIYPHQAEVDNLGNNLSVTLRGTALRGREGARMYMNFLARK